MFRKTFQGAAIFLLILLPCPRALAIYDPLSVPNNKFGVHILFPEEIDQVSQLVNGNNGSWGYVTIPIQSDDRNLEKWQKFFDKAKKNKIIPLLRLATYPNFNYWEKPTVYDPIDWGNFLNSLNWPIRNRYIIVGNEPNQASEWGNRVDPAEYAKFLEATIAVLKSKSQDFFVLNAGLDLASDNSSSTMDAFDFMKGMDSVVSGIFEKINGWSSHSYPNPDFRSSPSYRLRNSIYGFTYEQEFLKTNLGLEVNLPIFITETGWKDQHLSENTVASYFQQSFTDAWSDKKIVAITPFLLNAQEGEFSWFSLIKKSLEPKESYKILSAIPKIQGEPIK